MIPTKAGFQLQRLSGALFMLLALSHCAQFPTVDTPSGSGETAAADVPQQATSSEPSAVADPAAATVVLPVAAPKPALPAELQAQFQQAKQLMREQEYQAALRVLEPLAQTLPDAAGIGYNLALCYWQLQQTEQARLQLISLLAHQPDFVEALNLLGVLARQAGNFNQARRYWLEALAQQSDFASAHKNLGFLYELYLSEPQQARYHYQQYQQLSGDPMAEAWLRLLEQQE